MPSNHNTNLTVVLSQPAFFERYDPSTLLRHLGLCTCCVGLASVPPVTGDGDEHWLEVQLAELSEVSHVKLFWNREYYSPVTKASNWTMKSFVWIEGHDVQNPPKESNPVKK